MKRACPRLFCCSEGLLCRFRADLCFPGSHYQGVGGLLFLVLTRNHHHHHHHHHPPPRYLFVLLVMSLVFTLFAAVMWPTLARAVPPHQLGTANGVATAAQNLGLFLVPLLVGKILEYEEQNDVEERDSNSSPS